jgi:hypothetical protein
MGNEYETPENARELAGRMLAPLGGKLRTGARAFSEQPPRVFGDG